MMPDAPISGKLRFDPVITWGHIFIVCASVSSVFAAYYMMDSRITETTHKIAMTEIFISQMQKVNDQVLRQLEQLNKGLNEVNLELARQNGKPALDPGRYTP